jgi:hypothetical protein
MRYLQPQVDESHNDQQEKNDSSSNANWQSQILWFILISCSHWKIRNQHTKWDMSGGDDSLVISIWKEAEGNSPVVTLC